jgi:hypothetical protein
MRGFVAYILVGTIANALLFGGALAYLGIRYALGL